MYARLISAGLVVLVVAGAYAYGRFDGDRVRGAEESARRLQEAAEYGIAVNGLQTRYRAQEGHWAQAFGQVSAYYQEELKKHDKALADALAAGRLRDPYAQACNGAPTDATADPGRPDAGGAELSQQASDFLRSEAARADKIVEKLNYCIVVLERERQ